MEVAFLYNIGLAIRRSVKLLSTVIQDQETTKPKDLKYLFIYKEKQNFREIRQAKCE